MTAGPRQAGLPLIIMEDGSSALLEKRFFAPVLLSCHEEGLLSQDPNVNARPYEVEKSIRLHVANETLQEQKVLVRWSLRDSQSRIVGEEKGAGSLRQTSFRRMAGERRVSSGRFAGTPCILQLPAEWRSDFRRQRCCFPNAKVLSVCKSKPYGRAGRGRTVGTGRKVCRFRGTFK